MQNQTSATAGPTRAHQDYHRQFRLRGLLFCGQTAGIVAAGAWLEGSPDWTPLAVILVLAAVANGILWRALDAERPGLVFVAQLGVDVLALGGILHLTGGATNPLVWLLLLQVAIAATVLSRLRTWLMAATVIVVYSILMFFFRPVDGMSMHGGMGFMPHIVGMWLGFIVSTLLIAYFLQGMADNVRARDRALARVREQALRDERLISLGSLAASAAHDLGTPLGTLAVLGDEAAADLEDGESAAARDKLRVMDDQIARCKKVIARIASSAGVDAAQGGGSRDIAGFVASTVEDWRARRLDVEVRCHINEDAPALRMVAEQGLSNALMSLFDNAADASPDDVTVEADWSRETLAIRVSDRGAGFAPGQRGKAGKAFFSDKPKGHGLGLYLSHGIIERLGGRLTIRPRTGGGTAVEVRLPLAELRV